MGFGEVRLNGYCKGSGGGNGGGTGAGPPQVNTGVRPVDVKQGSELYPPSQQSTPQYSPIGFPRNISQRNHFKLQQVTRFNEWLLLRFVAKWSNPYILTSILFPTTIRVQKV